MLDRAARYAEAMVSAASRRRFLTWLGKRALVVAGGVGTLLTLPPFGRGQSSSSVTCCHYECQGGYFIYNGRRYAFTGRYEAVGCCSGNSCQCEFFKFTTNGLVNCPIGNGRTVRARVFRRAGD